MALSCVDVRLLFPSSHERPTAWSRPPSALPPVTAPPSPQHSPPSYKAIVHGLSRSLTLGFSSDMVPVLSRSFLSVGFILHSLPLSLISCARVTPTLQAVAIGAAKSRGVRARARGACTYGTPLPLRAVFVKSKVPPRPGLQRERAWTESGGREQETALV